MKSSNVTGEQDVLGVRKKWEDAGSLERRILRVSGLRVSVVICAFTEDRWDQLVAAIKSVEQQSHPAYEVVVVIDHNPPLLDRVRNLSSRPVAVENTEPRGLSGARNSGVAVSRGEIVAFLDDDAVAQPQWLESLCVGYEYPDVVGVGGSIEPDWREGRPRWFPPEFDWVVGCTYVGMPEQVSPVRNMIGANMSFRRETLTQLGGFRAEVSRIGASPAATCDDTEMCIRARQRLPGKLVLYNPAAKVKHHVPGVRGSVSYFAARCIGEGLSKVQVSRLVGAEDALSSEQRYVKHTLPAGIARGLAEAACQKQRAGFERAIAIVAGLALTAGSYCYGTVTMWARSVAIPGIREKRGHGG